MKTFGELVPDDVSKVAEIPLSAVRLLWIDDFWDGPLSGIAEWEGRRLRFEMTDRSKLGDEDENSHRQYWLIALSPDQLREEERWHELFCTHVWTGYDYTGRPAFRAPESEHAKFYGPYAARAVPDYSSNEVVGWFER